METLTREEKVTAAFVMVADTLIDDYDTIELLHTLVEVCADILATNAGGLMLADDSGQLQLVASTTESAGLVEILALNAGTGPCIDCFKTGKSISIGDLASTDPRWPVFREAALEQGFRSVHATPLRLRGTVLGTINLFSSAVGELNLADVAIVQALADVATIGIIQQHSIRHSKALAEQLQIALQSRVLIEQAKGAVAQSAETTPESAFTFLRKYARDNNLTLRGVCERVLDRTLTITNSDEAVATK
ncbi:GAF and ANTAR domain-containing protein [Frigoribacterium sp. CG_9.8]|uniref:GAF and ANTAR domain-containing protein n=1 Tax=Frigoribacterium sp. CG_9.8 TaxID=2787733 RepID=UPI0018C93040|nr:GAF and ANTAR domain-containing protein [Frigoribacterium sp. CG_9.8]MBG6107938.1 GAF domain-containing protein [Frigoribacterium sp. CG_9.8]